MDYQDAEAGLRRLDERLGKGVGAKKERARLQAVIDTVDKEVADRRAERLAKKHKVRH